MGHVKVTVKCATPHENESVPKIKINDNINLFLTAISSLLISYDNSFRLLFDKIASEYFIWKIYLYFYAGNGHPRERALCQLYRHTFVRYSRGAHLPSLGSEPVDT